MSFHQEIMLIIARTLAALCGLLIVLGAAFFVLANWDPRDLVRQTTNGDFCNIAVIPLEGEILDYDPVPDRFDIVTTTGDSVVEAIQGATYYPYIKGVMLRDDSYGGAAVASESIMRAMQNTQVPTLTYIRSYGLSGGYLAASGANWILANKYSAVGGIGVTESYLQQTKQDAKNGLEFIQISSGPNKDAMNPSNAITPAQKALAQRNVDIWAQQFIDDVARNRKLSTTSVAKVADGSSVPASLALESGLIDQIGDEDVARAWFTERIGEDAVFCAPSPTSFTSKAASMQ